MGLGIALTDDFYAPQPAAGAAPSEDAASAADACGTFVEAAASGCGIDRSDRCCRSRHPIHLQSGKYCVDAALSVALAHGL